MYNINTKLYTIYTAHKLYTECIYYKRPLFQVKAKHDLFIAFPAETVKKLFLPCFWVTTIFDFSVKPSSSSLVNLSDQNYRVWFII